MQGQLIKGPYKCASKSNTTAMSKLMSMTSSSKQKTRRNSLLTWRKLSLVSALSDGNSIVLSASYEYLPVSYSDSSLAIVTLRPTRKKISTITNMQAPASIKDVQ